MNKLLDLITEKVTEAFVASGYDGTYGKVSISNRPDLCEYQCNGGLAAAKQYHEAPIMIAKKVQEVLIKEEMFEKVEAVMPGFLNFNLSAEYLAEYLKQMQIDDRYGYDLVEHPRMIVIDYGGANVAKPLHVGHLRPAIIGESIKRIHRLAGHKVLGDVHLGDWGLPMGLVMIELKARKPELPYFNPDFKGEYPIEAPFTTAELEEIYPYASQLSKEDEAYKEQAMQATVNIQSGEPGYTALLHQILKVSIEDLKKNYGNLNVDFDLWLGESDAQPYIKPMIDQMIADGYAHVSEGALVVEVKEDSDTKEVPPCLIRKGDGASLYATTDLATLVQRMKDYNPDEVLYVVDKRQEMHFTQVFRTAKKTGIVPGSTQLRFLGFGTMNGTDGKPFKTRDGGVMRLESMIQQIADEMYRKITDNHTVNEAEGHEIAKKVGLAALKYGDLSNQASKDYVFDMERFTSFEGNTGPYLLYTIVRMKSILNKYKAAGLDSSIYKILPATNESEKALMRQLVLYNSTMEVASNEEAPHKVCSYIYDLANAFNHFYHENNIMAEVNSSIQGSYIRLLELTEGIMETCINVLGFEAPDRM